jgi:O-antigen ligase
VQTEKLPRNVILWGTAIVSLAITPFSFDPVNVPKFTFLMVVGFSVIALIIQKKESFKEKTVRPIVLATFAFVLIGMISFFVNKTNSLQQLFGVTGRHTGYFTYVCLAGLMLGTALFCDTKLIAKIPFFALGSGFISIIYGLVQVFDFDPLNWSNPYSPVIGFLGNPNFQSSFMAITSIVAFTLLLEPSVKSLLRVFLGSYNLLALFLIYKSNSQQGFLIFGAGLFVVVLLRIKTLSQSKNYSRIYFFSGTTIFIVAILDMLQKVPWTSILYKQSVSFRGDLWRAAWRISKENPFFGIGFDNFGDWYRRSRDQRAIINGTENTVSNAAHNVFLDISTSGGFPLLAAYATILFLTFRAIFLISRRSTVFNPSIVAIIGAWIAYLAQSVISINQIGLAIWGWVLSGAIIGYEIHTRENIEGFKKKTEFKKGVAIIGAMFGFGVGVLPFVSDLVYRSAIDSRQIERVEQAAYQWPQSGDRMILISSILRENGLTEKALIIARDATEFAPERFEAWQVLTSISTLPESEKSKALIKMKKLDPYNPNLK